MNYEQRLTAAAKLILGGDARAGELRGVRGHGDA